MAGTKGHSDARGTQPGGELGLSMSQRFETLQLLIYEDISSVMEDDE
jgi:hypothetical protein